MSGSPPLPSLPREMCDLSYIRVLDASKVKLMGVKCVRKMWARLS